MVVLYRYRYSILLYIVLVVPNHASEDETNVSVAKGVTGLVAPCWLTLEWVHLGSFACGRGSEEGKVAQ